MGHIFQFNEYLNPKAEFLKRKRDEYEKGVIYHKNMIKDIFQEIIDEYNIEYYDNGNGDGLYYEIDSEDWKGREYINEIIFEITHMNDKAEAASGKFGNTDLIQEIKSAILPIVGRLQHMGYIVSEIGNPYANVICLSINYKNLK